MRNYVLAFALLSALLFSGCAMNDKSVSNVYKSNNNEYVINSIPLDHKVAVVGYRSKFKDNLLFASVDVRNNDNESYDLEYRFRWFDDSGFEVEHTPWLPLTLNAKEFRSIQRISTTPKSETFKFYIRLKQ